MDEAGPKAGHRVTQLGQPDAPTDALLNSLRLRLHRSRLQFDLFAPSPTFEGNQP
jgi:hypothetical protein